MYLYTLLKSTFSELQLRLGQYGSIFICVAVVASQICEITRKLELKQFKVMDLVPVLYRCEVLMHKARK